MGEKTHKIAFYAKNEEGTADELILDLFERDYEYNGTLDERDLWERHGGRGREFQIEPAGLITLFSTVENTFGHGSFYTETKSYEVRQEEKRQWKRQQRHRELVLKERLWKAIRWECNEKELDDLRSYDKYRYEKDHYYDFALILDKIHAFMAGEKSVEYFTSWLVLLMRCLQEGMIYQKRRQKEIYFEIADWFDGVAFMSSDISEEQKRIECLELIAVLKDLNHRLENIEAKKDDPFTKNGVITYVTFGACVSGGKEVALSKVCIVDEDRETVNYLFVPDLVYREEINYTFLTEAEFDCLTSAYYEYMFDGTLKEDHAMTKVSG